MEQGLNMDIRTKSNNVAPVRKRKIPMGTSPQLVADASAENDKPKSLTLTVFETLRSDILGCELAPGTKLRISEIATRFDVSHAAVREALSRLVASGFLEALDQRGFRVTELSLKDLMDLTDTRIEIEALCLRKAIANGGSAWETTVRTAYQEMETEPRAQEGVPGVSDRFLKVHEEFHRALVVACGSDWLMNFRDRLSEQTQRYRRLSALYEGIPRDVNREHEDLMNAVLQRDAELAVDLMAAHTRRTTDTILRAQSGGFDLKKVPPR